MKGFNAAVLVDVGGQFGDSVVGYSESVLIRLEFGYDGVAELEEKLLQV